MAVVRRLEAIVETSGVSDFTTSMQAAQSSVLSLKKSVGVAGAALGALSAGGLAVAAAAASRFEDAMVEVEKVTDPSTAREMSDSIKEMAETIPLAQTELAGIAADAARFGVRGTENINKFTEATAKMATATDLNTQEAGEAFAKLSELTGTPIDQVENMGSSINELSNNFATSAQEIVDSMLRSAGAMSQFGLTQTEIAGFSTALNAVSESSERAGTRLRRLVQEVSNPKKMRDMARALGMTAEEFQAMEANNPRKLLMQMVEGFKEGGETADVLNRNLSTTSRQALAGLSQNLGGLRKALGMSADSFEENTSLQKEFNAAVDTFSSQAKLLLNTLTNVAITIGNVLLPHLTTLVSKIADGVQKFQDFNEATSGVPVAVGLITTAIVGLGTALAVFGPSVATVVGALSGIAGAIGSVMTAIAGVPSAIAGVGATFAGLATTIWTTLFSALMALPGAAKTAAVSLGTTLYSALISVGTTLIGLPGRIAAFALSLGTTLATAAVSAASSLVALPGIIAAKTAAMITSASVTGLVSGALGLLSTAASIASVSLAGVVATLGTLLLPLTLVAAGIAALYVAWQNNFLGLRDITNRVVKMVKALMAGDMKGAMNQAKLLVKDLKRVWQNQVIPIWNTTKRVFNQIKNTIMRVLNFIWKNLITPIINRIRKVWNRHGSELRAEAKETWKVIKGHFNTLKSFVMPLFNWFTTNAGKAWNKWGDEIMTVARFVFDIIVGVIETAVDAILTAISVTMDLIQMDWGEAWDKIAGFLERTLDGIIKFAEKWGGRFLDWLGKVVDDAIQTFIDFANELIGNSVIPDMLSDIIQAIKDWNIAKAFRNAVDGALDKVENLASDFTNAGEDLVGSFVDGMKDKADAAKGAAENVVEKIRDYLPGSDAKRGPLSDLTNSGSQLPITFAKGIENEERVVEDAVDRVAAKAMSSSSGRRVSVVGGNGGTTRNTINIDVTVPQGADVDTAARTIADELKSRGFN